MAAPPVFLSHPSSLEHDTGAHPEQPARIVAIQRELEARDWLGFERVESPAADRSVIGAVHRPGYIRMIDEVAAAGGRQLDMDTVVSEGSFEAALHAAGGAVSLVERLVSGDASTGFSAHRPPGHHATQSQAMGFCLFNNVAIAARYALEQLGLERVMIFDWDVHHGNGTNDIFHSSADILFVSIHQWPLYPGTGPASDVGSGEGIGYTVNLPVPAGSDDDAYVSLVGQVVAPLAVRFAPQLILISAGYDAHVDDPLAECHVTEAGFVEMTHVMRRACLEVGAPLGCVLEGGYALGALARSVAATLEALADPLPEGAVVGAADGSASVPLASAALGRLEPYWGVLG
jgi:acetoin utilization deacetylase AcuC-like enzyme